MKRAFILCAALAFLCDFSNAAERRPNVLFIALDGLNDWIGCLRGHPQTKTPNLDRPDSEGVHFLVHHDTTPICRVSRSGIMTELHDFATAPGKAANLHLLRVGIAQERNA